jgi:rhodanese-related sulfurtransferase
MKSIVRQIIILISIAFILAGTSASIYWMRGKWDTFRDPSVLLSEVSKWNDPVLWVDARSIEEYTSDHIPGAVRLTEDNWNELLPDLLKVWAPDSAIIVYCDSQKCHASNEVAKRLREEVGLKNVYTLRGGWTAWKGEHR